MKHIPDYIKSILDNKSISDYYIKYHLILTGLETHPEDKDYIYAWAISMIADANNYEFTLASCKKFLPLVEENDCISYIRSNLIHCYEKLDKFEEAMKLRLETIATTENPDMEMLNIAEIYEKKEDWTNTIKYYEMYIEECDYNCDSEIFWKLAVIYDKVNEYKKSAKYYEKAAKQDSEDAVWLWLNTGRAIALSGKEDESMFYFQMVLKMKPEEEMGHYYLGQIYQNKNDVYRALHHYTEALNINPKMAIVYNNMAGIFLEEDNNIKKAIEYVLKAVAVSNEPTFTTQLYLSLSKLYNKISDYDHQEFYKIKWLESMGFIPGFATDLSDNEEE